MTEYRGYSPKPTRPPERYRPTYYLDRHRQKNKEGLDLRKAALVAALTVAVGTTALIGGPPAIENFRHFVSDHLSKPALAVNQETPAPTKTPIPTATATKEAKPTASPTIAPATPTATTTKETKPTATTTHTTTKEAGLSQEVHVEGGKIITDKNGLPVKFISDSGKEIAFDKAKMQAARQKAMATGISQLIEVVKAEKSTVIPQNPPFEPSAAHPLVKELPKDVVPEEQLKKMGITIIPGKEVQLFVRQNAFEKGGPLEQFKDGQRNLIVVLVDGGVVSPSFMKDSRYDLIRNLLNDKQEEINTFRERHAADYQEARDDIQAKYDQLLKEGSQDQSKIDFYKHLIFQFNVHIYEYQQEMTDEEIIREIAGSETSAAGRYYERRYISIDKKTGEEKYATVMFVCVGGDEKGIQKNIFSFNGRGMIESAVIVVSGSGYYNYTPEPRQTHPNPADFAKNSAASPDNPLSYPYGAQAPGQILRHERAHDDDRAIATEKWAKGIKAPVINEYDTDTRAMEEITKAWKKWVRSGYQDDSGYHFILSVPKSRGGGFIYTFGESPIKRV